LSFDTGILSNDFSTEGAEGVSFTALDGTATADLTVAVSTVDLTVPAGSTTVAVSTVDLTVAVCSSSFRSAVDDVMTAVVVVTTFSVGMSGSGVVVLVTTFVLSSGGVEMVRFVRVVTTFSSPRFFNSTSVDVTAVVDSVVGAGLAFSTIGAADI